MSIATQITRLQNDKADILEALNLKGVSTPSGTNFDDIADMINNIEGPSNDWTRPSDWPDYSQIDISNEECLFFTYDSSDRDGADWAAFIAVCSGGYTVERGYLVDGVWTVDTTTEMDSGIIFSETLPTDRDYTVYKIYPTTTDTHITQTSMALPNEYNGYTKGFENTLYKTQKLLERYGNLPYVTRFGYGWGYRNWANYYLQAETLLSVDSVTNMNSMYSDCYSLKYINVDNWNTSNVTSMESLFNNCKALSEINVSNFDTSQVTSMQYMFRGCQSLKHLDVSNFDTSSCTSMYGTFMYCSSLRELNTSSWNTSNVTNMNSLFYNCYSLKYILNTNWDVSNVTSVQNMFCVCKSLIYIDTSSWRLSSCQNMNGMFNGCSGLRYVDIANLNPSSCTNMVGVFYECNCLDGIDLSNWDVSYVTTIRQMFSGCNSLKSINLNNWNTSNITEMNALFSNCYSLHDVNISGWDTSSVTTMESMFSSCNSLQNVDISSWDTTSCTNMKNLFASCYALRDIKMSNISQVYSNQFNGCRSVTSFTFDVSSVPTLENTNAFGGNNFANGQKILFPSSLVEDAKVATNWSTYADYIEAIS